MTRVFVALTRTLDAANWANRHAAGDVPDASPYGLHRLRDQGFDVEFSTPSPQYGRIGSATANTIHHRTDGLEIPHIVGHRHQLRSDCSDVVLAYDERTGFPAAMMPGRRRAPVITGVAWLGSPTATAIAHRAAARRSLRRVAALFTQCAPMVDLLADQWRLPRDLIHFVTLGIDTDFYAQQPWPDSDEPPVVASAGEDRFRDHQLLIDAVTSVRETIPDTRLELATALQVDLPTEWGTLYTERLNGRMRELYRKSTVVAVALEPTATGSGLTVVAEAMASGRPVVVTGNPGVSDYVRHGETGLLVRPNDKNAFADAVRSLLSDPERAREMGERAALVARREFSSATMAKQLGELITATL